MAADPRVLARLWATRQMLRDRAERLAAVRALLLDARQRLEAAARILASVVAEDYGYWLAGYLRDIIEIERKCYNIADVINVDIYLLRGYIGEDEDEEEGEA